MANELMNYYMANELKIDWGRTRSQLHPFIQREDLFRGKFGSKRVFPLAEFILFFDEKMETIDYEPSRDVS